METLTTDDWWRRSLRSKIVFMCYLLSIFLCWTHPFNTAKGWLHYLCLFENFPQQIVTFVCGLNFCEVVLPYPSSFPTSSSRVRLLHKCSFFSVIFEGSVIFFHLFQLYFSCISISWSHLCFILQQVSCYLFRLVNNFYFNYIIIVQYNGSAVNVVMRICVSSQTCWTWCEF